MITLHAVSPSGNSQKLRVALRLLDLRFEEVSKLDQRFALDIVSQ